MLSTRESNWMFSSDAVRMSHALPLLDEGWRFSTLEPVGPEIGEQAVTSWRFDAFTRVANDRHNTEGWSFSPPPSVAASMAAPRPPAEWHFQMHRAQAAAPGLTGWAFIVGASGALAVADQAWVFANAALSAIDDYHAVACDGWLFLHEGFQQGPIPVPAATEAAPPPLLIATPDHTPMIAMTQIVQGSPSGQEHLGEIRAALPIKPKPRHGAWNSHEENRKKKMEHLRSKKIKLKHHRIVKS